MTDTGSAYFEASNAGTVIFCAGRHSGHLATLVWVDCEGREEPLGTPPMPYIYPRLSPDGRRVGLDVGGPNRDIYVWDIARRVLERLTTDPAEDAIVRWSPDGSKIAYANSRYGIPNVFWQAADGSGAPERLLESPVLQHPNSFTPDGALVVSELVPGRGRGLAVMTLARPDARGRCSRTRSTPRCRRTAAGWRTGRRSPGSSRSTSRRSRTRAAAGRSLRAAAGSPPGRAMAGSSSTAISPAPSSPSR